jgi:hypothetical protein
MIPIRIKSTGNAEACNNLVGFAKKQMTKLEESMAFQNLSQGVASISPYNGALIKCTSCFSLRVIEIHVGPSGGGGGFTKECFCNCFFARGYILEIIEYPDEDNLAGIDTRYTVAVCHKDKYVIYENCLPSDFFDYTALRKDPLSNMPIPVIVIMSNTINYNTLGKCCDPAKPYINASTPCYLGLTKEALGEYTNTSTVLFQIIPVQVPLPKFKKFKNA